MKSKVIVFSHLPRGTTSYEIWELLQECSVTGTILALEPEGTTGSRNCFVLLDEPNEIQDRLKKLLSSRSVNCTVAIRELAECRADPSLAA